jgi:hypothetical protein
MQPYLFHEYINTHPPTGTAVYHQTGPIFRYMSAPPALSIPPTLIPWCPNLAQDPGPRLERLSTVRRGRSFDTCLSSSHYQFHPHCDSIVLKFGSGPRPPSGTAVYRQTGQIMVYLPALLVLPTTPPFVIPLCPNFSQDPSIHVFHY